jgi:hypothetical protein
MDDHTGGPCRFCTRTPPGEQIMSLPVGTVVARTGLTLDGVRGMAWQGQVALAATVGIEPAPLAAERI